MSTHAAKQPLLTDELYKGLKFLAMIALPVLGTLYYSLAGIWGLPNADQVVGTITVVDTALGALLAVSTRSYNNSEAPYDGELKVATDAEGERVMYSLNLNDDVTDIPSKKQLVFKVEPH